VSYVIQLIGSGFSRTEVIEPGAPPIIVGRDSNAAIHLPDPERLISRKHIALDWADNGVRVTVLSTVNGIITENGETPPGQHIVLQVGKSAQFGPYSLTVVSASPGQHIAPTGHQKSDQFDAFSPEHASPESIFDNMFFQPRHQGTISSAPDVSDSAGGLSFGRGAPALLPHASRQTPSAGLQIGVSRSSSFSPLDPISVFDNNVPDHVAPAHCIDDFLGKPISGTGGLGASMLLKATLEAPIRRLAVDHVHDFNLPLRPPTLQSTVGASQGLQVQPDPGKPSISERSSGLSEFAPNNADPWADIQAKWLSPSEGSCETETEPALADSHPLPEGSHSTAINFDPFNDAWSESPVWPDGPESGVAAGGQVDSIDRSHASGEPDSSRTSISEASIDNLVDVPASVSTATQSNEATLAAFCRGLGIDSPSHLSESSWEQMGCAIRAIVGGLTELMGVRAEVKRELRAPDRTMLASHNNNPLKSGMSLDEVLQYVLFNSAGVGGYMPVNSALEETIGEMRAHEFASVAAARGAVEGSLQEFSPETLRAALLKNKSKLPNFLNDARLWHLYAEHYEQKSQHMADWLEQIFNYYFMPVYSRESERFRNNASKGTAKS